MKNTLHIAAALVLALATAGASAAQNAAETIFTADAIDDGDVGKTLKYDYAIAAPEGAGIHSFAEGGAEIEVVRADDGGTVAVIALDRDGVESRLNEMPISGGNPLVMIFLEQTSRAMAELTGGSPYYIRNRMKEALLTEGERETSEVTLDGATAEITTIRLRPFAGDPNRAEMGDFYDIELSFGYGDTVPGGIYELDAQAGPEEGEANYRQTLSFTGEDAS